MAVLLAAPILLSITLLISGLAKLGAREGTQDAMRSLRLPLPAFHASVASVLPGFDQSAWFGMAVPASTPAPIIARANAAMNKVLNSPDFAERALDAIHANQAGSERTDAAIGVPGKFEGITDQAA